MGKQCAPLHRLRLGDIDRRIAALLAEIETVSGPVNRARSSLSAFFAWAITEGLLDANPVVGTVKVNEGGSRERVLTKEEPGKLWLTLRPLNRMDLIEPHEPHRGVVIRTIQAQECSDHTHRGN